DRVLTDRVGGSAEASTISKDGRQVAYTWLDDKSGGYQLRVVALQGAGLPTPRILLDGDISYVVPHDWFPDGRLAVSLSRGDRTGQIGILTVSSGAYAQLTSVDCACP